MVIRRICASVILDYLSPGAAFENTTPAQKSRQVLLGGSAVRSLRVFFYHGRGKKRHSATKRGK